MKRRAAEPLRSDVGPLLRATDAMSDDEVRERFWILLQGFLAEADLRGMSPLAVFFDWIHDLEGNRPTVAAELLDALPRATRRAYREWSDGGDAP
jgi:hypothetical protein